MQASPDAGPIGEIAQCALCGREGPVAKVIPVYTAIRHATTEKTGFKEYTTTTYTGAVREFHRKVCEECVATADRNRRSVTIATLVVLAAVLALSIASDVAWGWIVLMALVVVGLAGNYEETYVDLGQQVKRATTGARPRLFGDKSGGEGVVGFTETEFKSYVKKHQR